MAFLLGCLHLRPADAWAMTLLEYDAAWRGYCQANGIDTSRRGMTRDRLEELKRLYPDAA